MRICWIGTQTRFKALKHEAYYVCYSSNKVCNFAAQNIDEYAASMLFPQPGIGALFHAVVEFNPWYHPKKQGTNHACLSETGWCFFVFNDHQSTYQSYPIAIQTEVRCSVRFWPPTSYNQIPCLQVWLAPLVDLFDWDSTNLCPVGPVGKNQA